MWLLNASTRRLESFMDDRQIYGQYAILSHTWEDQEVSFDEIQRDIVKDKAGFRKIDNACAQALADHLKYVWVDTCCIDKSSSAELSQAINSMFRWYYHASVCYVYLSDFTLEARDPLAESQQQISTLACCRWFTRGWTLQELIAPEKVHFFDKLWTPIAPKSSIAEILANITNIDQDVLINRESFRNACVATRMSWAANRSTTLAEDRAYSLLGIFDINMPLLYGEGDSAFKRLQEEIIRTWSRVDHSILAWHGSGDGLLAVSPDRFPVYLPPKTAARFSDQERRVKRDIISWSLPQNEIFELSNKGLRISVYACPTSTYSRVLRSAVGVTTLTQAAYNAEKLIVALNCSYGARKGELFALHLTRRPWVGSGEPLAGVSGPQDYAIYDFEPEYTTVKMVELCQFTVITVTIARTLYSAAQTDVQVHLLWKAYRYSVHTANPPSAWTADHPRFSLHQPKVADEMCNGTYLLLKHHDHNDSQRIILDVNATVMDRLQLPKLFVRVRRPGFAGRWKETFEIKSGERRVLDISGEPLLALFARYLVLAGKIVWDVSVSDPRSDGVDMDFTVG